MTTENPYRTLHARMSPPGAAWDEGFAAGRAAAHPDPPDDWTAAILTLRRAMCTPAGREQVERELIRPFAASPDERLREALRVMIDVFDRHDRWCGHYADAPGDGIIHKVPAARAALAADREAPDGCARCSVLGLDGCGLCAPAVPDDQEETT